MVSKLLPRDNLDTKDIHFTKVKKLVFWVPFLFILLLKITELISGVKIK